jgi:hypothetical protein
MAFLHIRNVFSGLQYDVSEAAIRRWPEEFEVIDDKPVSAPRPPRYFDALASEPSPRAKKTEWEEHARLFGVDPDGLSVKEIIAAIEAAKASTPQQIEPVEVPPAD